MKCHYEVLNLERDADDNEIKQAYRKLALKWHPDKNLYNTEDAKEQFQLVQQAYEVLSDRQERAWYDKHREQILRGSNTDYKDNNLDVFQYFTTTCFKGYSDDENGFYCTYANVFEQIGKEDLEYMDDKDSMYEIPKFGNSQSDYDEVVGPFYDYWMSYSTRKSYVWLDPHDIKEAPNRKVFKLIEKENDKIRQKAKKERNEEVRSLVAFVRKRDKRVQMYIKNLEAKKIENREKQKKLSNQKRQERIKQLNESSEQAEWMKFENVKSELEEIEKKLAAQFGDELSDTEENSDEDINNLYCVACNKIFKTPKAFKNHESSKKHKENIENLKKAMMEDDLLHDSNEDEIDNQFENNSLVSSDNENNISFPENETVNETKSKKKNKKSKNVIIVPEDQSENNSPFSSENENENGISSAENENIKETKSKKKNKKSKNVFKVTEVSDIEYSSTILEHTEESTENEIKPNIKQKRRKRKEKQSKKENKELENHEESASNTKTNGHFNDVMEEFDKEKCCKTCNTKFPSKNKLFEHLKKTGHSTYINSNNLEKSKKKGVKLK